MKGYLRTGKILRMMDKPDLALKIYERGLRYASVQSQQYAVSTLLSSTFKQNLPCGLGDIASSMPSTVHPALPFESFHSPLSVTNMTNSLAMSVH